MIIRTIFTTLLFHALSASDVCYTYGDCDLGCFTDDYPFGHTDTRPLPRLPGSPIDINPEFWLDTRWATKVILDPRDPSSISKSTFDASQPTKFIIHGYTDAASSSWMEDMSRKFLVLFPMANVIRAVSYTHLTLPTKA